MARKLRFEVGKASHPGKRRDQNEDSLGFFEPEDPDQLVSHGALYIVADGMGGHEAGAVASDRAVRKTIDEYYYGGLELDIEESLERAIKRANEETFGLAPRKPDWAGMGTTIVAAVLRGDNELYVANVGDSRAYIVRGEEVRQVTEDHTWVAEQVKNGRLTPEEAREHPRRSQITRSLGRRPDIEVDMFKETLQPGDIVVLCSDGLSDVVRDEEIQAVVSNSRPQEAADQLIELANRRGGPDNITAIVIGPPRSGLDIVAGGIPPLALVGALLVVGAMAVGLFALGSRRGSATPTPIAMLPSPTVTEVTKLPPDTPSAPIEGAKTQPLPTPSPTSGTQEATLLPTSTLAELPTAPSTAPPPTVITRASVTPKPTAQPTTITAITPYEPPNGEGRTGRVWLRWNWDGALGEDQWFEVSYSRKGDTTPIEVKRTREGYLEWCHPEKDDYVWQVRLVDEAGNFLGVASEPWSFGWAEDCRTICVFNPPTGKDECRKDCGGCP